MIGLRVLFYISEIRPGGVATALRNAANALARAGHDVTIAGNELEKLQRLLAPVKTIKRGSIPKRTFVARLLDTPFDLYIGVQGHNALWLIALALLRAQSRPIVSWEHSSPITSVKNEFPSTWRLHALTKIISTHLAARVCCVSRGAVRELQHTQGVRANRVQYLPNIIFDRADQQARPHRRSEAINFLSVGRLAPEKDLQLALRALRDLKNSSWLYTIVGDGPARADLERMCDEDPMLKGRVTFAGWADDLNPFYLQADCILLPSKYEGMPTVLVEACLHSVPIIASDCRTGPSELVHPGRNGFLFPVGDLIALKATIEKFVEHRAALSNSWEYAADFETRNAEASLLAMVTQVARTSADT